LGGLTLGYFLGGLATYRISLEKLLFGVLLAGTLFIAFMPTLALTVIPTTYDLGLRLGSFVSTNCIMLLPLICKGMV
jgi:hypothetical protein